MHSQANTYGLLKLGIDILRSLPYIMVLNDKAPGYTCVARADLEAVETAALQSPLYEPIMWEVHSLSSVVSMYTSLAGKIAKECKVPSYRAQILSSMDGGLLPSVLGLTCKTHKQPGAVTMRTIHRGLNPCFNGLSRWLVKMLQPICDVGWLLRDTGHFVQKLKSVTIASGYKQGCIDLKDFYLSGEPCEIAEEVSKAFSGTLRGIIYDSIFFLLNNQLVVTQSLGSFFKCMRGSGIGLLHSAHLTSAMFILTVEKPLFEKVAQTDIISYCRFHDDIHVITPDSPKLHNIFREMKATSSVFKYECRSVGSHESPCEFLDVTVSFVGSGVCIAPTQEKPISPLCVSSAHAPSIHSSWPKSLVNRYINLVHNTDLSGVFDVLLDRYVQANAHPDTISHFREAISQALGTNSPSTKQLPSKPSFACVLSYHPVALQAVRHALKILPAPDAFPFSVFASWKNSLPSIQGIASKVGLSSCSRREGRWDSCFLSTYQNNCNLEHIRLNPLKGERGLQVLSLHSMHAMQRC